MIETVVCEYLISQQLDKVGDHVYMETPVHPPSEYIVIEKTASGVTNKIRNAMIAVQSISGSRKEYAGQINEAVVEAMDIFAEKSDKIYSCKLNTDYDFTDPDTKKYRYQAVFNLYY